MDYNICEETYPCPYREPDETCLMDFCAIGEEYQADSFDDYFADVIRRKRSELYE